MQDPQNFWDDQVLTSIKYLVFDIDCSYCIHIQPCQQCSRQEAVLAMPYSFATPILNAAPTDARPLRTVESGKAKKYLELAQIILQRFSSDTMGRAVEFLVDVVRNRDPGPLPPLPWYTTAGMADAIQVGLPAALARIAPAMVFQARIRG